MWDRTQPCNTDWDCPSGTICKFPFGPPNWTPWPHGSGNRIRKRLATWDGTHGPRPKEEIGERQSPWPVKYCKINKLVNWAAWNIDGGING